METRDSSIELDASYLTDSSLTTQDGLPLDLLRRLVDDLPMAGAVLQGSAHRIIIANALFSQLARGTGDLIGRTVAEVWPEMAGEVVPFLDRVYHEGRSLQDADLPMQIVRDHGSEAVFITSSSIPLRDGAGRVGGILILAHETTAQVLARAEGTRLAAQMMGAYQSMSEGLGLLDPQGNVVSMNPAARSMVVGSDGDGDDETRHWTAYADLWDIHDTAGAPLSLDDLPPARALRGESFSGVEVVLIHRDSGAQTRLAFGGAPVCDASGEPMGAVITFHDVTTHHQVEQALRESQAHYRSLFATISEAFVLWQVLRDGEGKSCDLLYLDVNPAYERRVHRRRDEIVGHTWRELFPDGPQEWLEAYARVEETGEPFSFERYGLITGLYYQGLAFRPAAGQCAALLRDITQEKLAEQTLRESEARYRRLFEQMSDAFVLYELVCNDEGAPCDLRYLDVNPVLAHIIGWPRDEIVGRTLGELFPGALHDSLERVRRVARTGEPERFEQVGGITDHLYDRLVFSPAPGQCAIISRDITEQRQVEQALREFNETLEQRVHERTAQLRALATEMSRVEERERHRVARVLHDDMQQLLVAAQMQARIARYVPPEQQPEALNRICELVDESIHLSRNLTAELSPPLLYDAGLPAALGWLARWMRERHALTIELHVDENARVPDEGLRAFLFQATRELLLNVVKHAGVQQATLTLERQGDEIVLVVQDAGAGSGANAMPSPDTGYGLFGISERLEYMGGHMEFASTPGRGTRVTLRAPRRDADRATSPTDDAAVLPVDWPALAALGSIRVLVADDHRVMRQGLVMMLEQEEDITVVGEADNGRQAVDMARALRPDVVLMDVSMPIMDGIEATAVIHRELPETRIIGLSMFTEAEVAQRMHSAGAVAYLSKGEDMHELINAIRQVARPREE
jgi:PAS domain S-box-containing protein